MAKLDEGFKFQMSLEEEEEEKESVVDFEQQFAQNGSIACNFVELNPWHYTQEERQSFYQRSMQSVLCLVSDEPKPNFIRFQCFVGGN